MWCHCVALMTQLLAVLVYGAQYFQERPKDTNVIRGQTAVLKCVIGDRKGLVQWTKDGFSLGFNRTIPGLDRYSITSSHPNEWNLMIVNAALEDDAVYECQVLPKDGDGKLQATATLTVLVPCETPSILDYSNGSTVEISYSQRSHDLVCEARDGRPAATIEWFRNGRKVTENIRYSVESRPNDKRETARSTLTISLTNHKSENEAIYVCQARNTAVFGPPLSTTVSISVLYPPSPPVITGYDNRVINIDTRLTLSCSSEGGNPLGSVTWYRNGRAVQHNYTTRGQKSTNEYIFTVSSSDNDAIYECRVTNMVTDRPLVKSYTLQVQFPPSSVRISGADAPVQEGSSVKLVCETSNSNPAATIQWKKGADVISDSDSEVTFRDSPSGGKITRSEINVMVSSSDDNSNYTCLGENTAAFPGRSVTATKTLSVLYPPNEPKISGYISDMNIKAGDLQRMTCMSVGGNPLADLKWYKGNQILRDADYKALGKIASSEIAIIASADDNKAVYKCRATSRATDNRPMDVSITLSVHFPPTQVVITKNPSQPKAGLPLDLVCMSSSSNPPAEITWRRNGRRMAGVDLGTVDSTNGGKNTTNRLSFIPTSRDHNAIFACMATNKALDRSVNDAVTLNVLFKPEFDNETLPSRVDCKKGESTVLNLTAYANPPEVTYELYKEGYLFTAPAHFSLDKGVLNISKVEKDDKGNYMVKGSNNQGFTFFNFSVNVKYPAEIIEVTNSLSLNEGETAIFSCKVDANPTVPNLVTWSRDNFDMTRTHNRIEGSVSYLSITNLTRYDSGLFNCVADNRVGSPSVKTAELLVKFVPVIDKSPEIGRSAGEKGSTVNLKCIAQGVPRIVFTWSRNNNPLHSSHKYKIEITNTSLMHFESTLQVKDLDSEDYGAYVCTATNSKGSDSRSITLTGTSKPNPPYYIEFVNATSNSITITWKPGFDGGLPQSFRVRYNQAGSVNYKFADVVPYGATIFTIKGLELGTLYTITVRASNDRGWSEYQNRTITAKTSAVVTAVDISSSELQNADEIPVIIILVVCIVGVFILTLNVGLILFFIRRRKKRLEATSDTTSHTNTFELYGNSVKGENPYPPPSDDTRSYGTYDKSMDDFSDEYIRDYDGENPQPQEKPQENVTMSASRAKVENNMSTNDNCANNHECETHVFLPQQPDYPGSRPYSPQKIESPRMGSGHKIPYHPEDQQERNSLWNEDPYRVAQPRQKKGSYDNGMTNEDAYEFRNIRSKGMNECSDYPPSRPSSRTGKTPPPPPTRSSSRGGFNTRDFMPPLPARNYEPQEIISQPRYTPTPGSSALLSPNPSYSGPGSNQRTPSPHNTLPAGAEFRGHLV
ncbi:nephrin [Biomphalaria glabrata]|nr:nephrin [Biomphalaria glabrata]